MQPLSHGQGLIPARIMLVGDVWSSSDEIACAPFSGSAGQELNRMLHDAKILRSDCYATNVVNAYPPGGDAGHWVKRKKKDITPTDIPYRDAWVSPIFLQGLEQLKAEVSLVKPNLIIALGNAALWALTGLWGVTRQRGSQLHSDDEFGVPVKVIPTIHPAAVMREWGWRQIAVNDLRRAKRFENVAGPLYGNEPTWDIIIQPTFSRVMEVISALQARVDGGEVVWVEVDLETSMTIHHILCLGLSWSRTEAISIPFLADKQDYWTFDEELAVIKALRKLLTHENIRVRWQNGLFDAQYIYRYWLFIPQHGQDTMLSHHVMYAGMRKSLDFQASLYCDYYSQWKPDKGEFKVGG